MPGENFDVMAQSFARLSYTVFKRRLVLQRTPKEGEVQTDERGFPIETPTDIQSVSTPIPCQYRVRNGRDVVIAGKSTTTTIYEFTIPRLYKDSTDNLSGVDFSTAYRVKLLANGNDPEEFFEIITGGKDIGPAIIFDAKLA